MENACGTSHMESAGEVVKILYDMVEKWTKETFERYTFCRSPLYDKCGNCWGNGKRYLDPIKKVFAEMTEDTSMPLSSLVLLNMRK